MRRRQATYARRHRDRRQAPPETSSSPLQEIDPEGQIDYSEMTRRMLKRSRRSISAAGAAPIPRAQGHNPKKLKTSPGPRGRQEQADGVLKSLPLNQDSYGVETPHPTLLTESQRYKLESSRGSPLPPDHKFSPVPLVQPLKNIPPVCYSRPSSIEAKPRQKITLSKQTSSSNLKENAHRQPSRPRPKALRPGTDGIFSDSRPFTKLKAQHQAPEVSLASPFASQPTSPYVSSKLLLSHDQETSKSSRLTQVHTMKPKRALSDTHYNPNLPTHVQIKSHAQSVVSSPTQSETESLKIRRPSAPSAIAHRPDVASWFVSSNILPGPKSESTEPNASQDASGRAFSVDFNRPPSQLSYASSYDDDFFLDALGMSTPFGLKNFAAGQAVLLRSGNDALDSTDSESDEDLGGGRLGPVSYRPSRSGLDIRKTLPPELTESLWLSDSFISPSTALRERAYSQSPPKPVNDNVNVTDAAVEDSLGLGSPFGQNVPLQDFYQEIKRADGLKELFDCLEISFDGGNQPKISRARSLDSDQVDVPALHSPAYISPTKDKNANGSTNVRSGRDRRGTIRVSDFQNKRQGDNGVAELVGGARRTRSGTIVGPVKRDRSGTIIARPPNLVITHRNDTDVDMQEASLVSKDVREGFAMHEVYEFEDEMLLKGHWHDEDWVVAENPSPVVPRKNPKRREPCWRKEWEKNKNREKKQRKLGVSIGNWGVSEHDEDDGDDDPLDLFK